MHGMVVVQTKMASPASSSRSTTSTTKTAAKTNDRSKGKRGSKVKVRKKSITAPAKATAVKATAAKAAAAKSADHAGDDDPTTSNTSLSNLSNHDDMLSPVAPNKLNAVVSRNRFVSRYKTTPLNHEADDSESSALEQLPPAFAAAFAQSPSAKSMSNQHPRSYQPSKSLSQSQHSQSQQSQRPKQRASTPASAVARRHLERREQFNRSLSSPSVVSPRTALCLGSVKSPTPSDAPFPSPCNYYQSKRGNSSLSSIVGNVSSVSSVISPLPLSPAVETGITHHPAKTAAPSAVMRSPNATPPAKKTTPRKAVRQRPHSLSQPNPLERTWPPVAALDTDARLPTSPTASSTDAVKRQSYLRARNDLHQFRKHNFVQARKASFQKANNEVPSLFQHGTNPRKINSSSTIQEEKKEQTSHHIAPAFQRQHKNDGANYQPKRNNSSGSCASISLDSLRPLHHVGEGDSQTFVSSLAEDEDSLTYDAASVGPFFDDYHDIQLPQGQKLPPGSALIYGRPKPNRTNYRFRYDGPSLLALQEKKDGLLLPVVIETSGHDRFAAGDSAPCDRPPRQYRRRYSNENHDEAPGMPSRQSEDDSIDSQSTSGVKHCRCDDISFDSDCSISDDDDDSFNASLRAPRTLELAKENRPDVWVTAIHIPPEARNSTSSLSASCGSSSDDNDDDNAMSNKRDGVAAAVTDDDDDGDDDGGPPIVHSRSSSDSDNDDLQPRKWKMKRVWNVDDMDAHESEIIADGPEELMANLEHLFGVPSEADSEDTSASTSSTTPQDDDPPNDTARPWRVAKLLDVDGHLIQGQKEEETAMDKSGMLQHVQQMAREEFAYIEESRKPNKHKVRAYSRPDDWISPDGNGSIAARRSWRPKVKQPEVVMEEEEPNS